MKIQTCVRHQAEAIAVFGERLKGGENMPDVSALLTDDEIRDLYAFLLRERR